MESAIRNELTTLYKQLDKKRIYIHYNYRNLSIVFYQKHNHLANNNYSYIHNHTPRPIRTHTQENTHAYKLVSHRPLRYSLQLAYYQYSFKNFKERLFQSLLPTPPPPLSFSTFYPYFPHSATNIQTRPLLFEKVAYYKSSDLKLRQGSEYQQRKTETGAGD